MIVVMNKIVKFKAYKTKIQLQDFINVENIEDFDIKLYKLLLYPSLLDSIKRCNIENVPIINEFSDNLYLNKEYKARFLLSRFINTLLLYKIRPTNSVGVDYLSELDQNEIKYLLNSFYLTVPITRRYINKVLLPNSTRFYLALYLRQLFYLSKVGISIEARLALTNTIKRYLNYIYTKKNNIFICENIIIKASKLSYKIFYKEECNNPLEYVDPYLKYLYVTYRSNLFDKNSLPDKYKRFLMNKILSI